MIKKRVIVINSKDNVATALDNLEAGEVIQEKVDSLKKNIKLNQDVPLDINLV
ncbi:MAG: hypothetical protein U9N08_04440 [Candidatus Caldatribacteriota bacterium]|nr:hypothetical protein [Candidatus Caldatribacteriota bacterium]